MARRTACGTAHGTFPFCLTGPQARRRYLPRLFMGIIDVGGDKTYLQA